MDRSQSWRLGLGVGIFRDRLAAVICLAVESRILELAQVSTPSVPFILGDKVLKASYIRFVGPENLRYKNTGFIWQTTGESTG